MIKKFINTYGELLELIEVPETYEGCNLVDCKIGIFVSINSSEILVKQKNGRLLRHKEPVIIIPYYINTREEELVKQMLENYNPELVSTITKFDDIVL